MKIIKYILCSSISIFFIFVFAIDIQAQRGCCSWHGGVSGQCFQGRVVCNDGTLSPSCSCDYPEYLYPRSFTPRNSAYHNSLSWGREIIFQDWRVNNQNADLKSYTIPNTGIQLDKSRFEIRYSKSNSCTTCSGFININNNRYNMYVGVNIYFPYFTHKNDVNMYYSINGRNFEKCNISDIAMLDKKYAAVSLVIDSFTDFFVKCQKGQKIIFKIENSKGWVTQEYSLFGFTKSYSFTREYLSSRY